MQVLLVNKMKMVGNNKKGGRKQKELMNLKIASGNAQKVKDHNTMHAREGARRNG